MLAVCTGIDSHPIKSLAIVLRSVGYEVKMLTDASLARLRLKGYTGGVDAAMLDNMGYIKAGLPEATEDDLEKCDIFVDIKVKEADTLMPLYPRLKGRTVIFLINGGCDGYENYGDFYPVITNNFWVKKNAFKCWMPFDNVQNLQPRKVIGTDPPMGLLHNAYNWGFKSLVDPVIAKTGLRLFGSYGSPMGILPNQQAGEYLMKSSSFVHLKASDCPGYALYEAFACGVPVIVTELFIARMQYQDLYEDSVTCLTWGKTSFTIDEKDPSKITEYMDDSRQTMIDEIADCVERLKDYRENKRIGIAGYLRWKKLTEWTPKKQQALHSFLKTHGF